VPRGFKVVGQDADGFWSLEKDDVYTIPDSDATTRTSTGAGENLVDMRGGVANEELAEDQEEVDGFRICASASES